MTSSSSKFVDRSEALIAYNELKQTLSSSLHQNHHQSLQNCIKLYTHSSIFFDTPKSCPSLSSSLFPFESIYDGSIKFVELIAKKILVEIDEKKMNKNDETGNDNNHNSEDSVSSSSSSATDSFFSSVIFVLNFLEESKKVGGFLSQLLLFDDDDESMNTNNNSIISSPSTSLSSPKKRMSLGPQNINNISTSSSSITIASSSSPTKTNQNNENQPNQQIHTTMKMNAAFQISTLMISLLSKNFVKVVNDGEDPVASVLFEKVKYWINRVEKIIKNIMTNNMQQQRLFAQSISNSLFAILRSSQQQQLKKSTTQLKDLSIEAWKLVSKWYNEQVGFKELFITLRNDTSNNNNNSSSSSSFVLHTINCIWSSVSVALQKYWNNDDFMKFRNEASGSCQKVLEAIVTVSSSNNKTNGDGDNTVKKCVAQEFIELENKLIREDRNKLGSWTKIPEKWIEEIDSVCRSSSSSATARSSSFFLTSTKQAVDFLFRFLDHHDRTSSSSSSTQNKDQELFEFASHFLDKLLFSPSSSAHFIASLKSIPNFTEMIKAICGNGLIDTLANSVLTLMMSDHHSNTVHQEEHQRIFIMCRLLKILFFQLSSSSSDSSSVIINLNTLDPVLSILNFFRGVANNEYDSVKETKLRIFDHLLSRVGEFGENHHQDESAFFDCVYQRIIINNSCQGGKKSNPTITAALQLVSFIISTSNSSTSKTRRAKIAMCCRGVISRCVTLASSSSSSSSSSQEATVRVNQNFQIFGGISGMSSLDANNNNNNNNNNNTASSSSSPCIPSDTHSVACLLQCCNFLLRHLLEDCDGDIYSARELVSLPFMIAVTTKKKYLMKLAKENFIFFNEFVVKRFEDPTNNNNKTALGSYFDTRSEWGKNHLGRRRATVMDSDEQKSPASSVSIPKGVVVCCIDLIKTPNNGDNNDDSSSFDLQITRYEPVAASSNNNSNTPSPLKKFSFTFPGLGSSCLEWLLKFQNLIEEASNHARKGISSSLTLAKEDDKDEGCEPADTLIDHVDDDDYEGVLNDESSSQSHHQRQHHSVFSASATKKPQQQQQQQRIQQQQQDKHKKLKAAQWWSQRKEFDRKAKKMIVDELNNELLLGSSFLLSARKIAAVIDDHSNNNNSNNNNVSLSAAFNQFENEFCTDFCSSSSSSSSTIIARNKFIASLLSHSLLQLTSASRSSEDTNNSIIKHNQDAAGTMLHDVLVSCSQKSKTHQRQQQQTQAVLLDDDDDSEGNNNNNSDDDQNIDVFVQHIAERIFNDFLLGVVVMSQISVVQNATTMSEDASSLSSSVLIDQKREEFVEMCDRFVKKVIMYSKSNHRYGQQQQNIDHQKKASSVAREKIVLVVSPHLRNIPFERLAVFNKYEIVNNNCINHNDSREHDYQHEVTSSSCCTPILDSASVYRAPSVKFVLESYRKLHQQQQQQEQEQEQERENNNEEKTASSSQSSSSSSVHCVLDPNGDLRSKCVKVYQDLIKAGNWSSSSSSLSSSVSSRRREREDDQDDNKEDAKQKQFLLYVGHDGPEKGGSNSHYPRREIIRRLDDPSDSASSRNNVQNSSSSSSSSSFPVLSSLRAVIAMGCSSSKTNHQLDPTSGYNTWLLSGCSTHIGCLWDVTDYELDRIAKRALKVFFDLSSSSSSSSKKDNDESIAHQNTQDLSGISSITTSSSNDSNVDDEHQQKSKQQQEQQQQRLMMFSAFRPDLPEAFVRASRLGASFNSSTSSSSSSSSTTHHQNHEQSAKKKNKSSSTTCKFSYLSGAAIVCYGVPGMCCRKK